MTRQKDKKSTVRPRNTSHFTGVFHLIDVCSALLPLRTLPLSVSCSPCVTHVRAPSTCQRDTFFFIDRVYLGVPNRKGVIEIHHYQSHKRVVGVPLNGINGMGKHKKHKKEKRKREKQDKLERRERPGELNLHINGHA